MGASESLVSILKAKNFRINQNQRFLYFGEFLLKWVQTANSLVYNWNFVISNLVYMHVLGRLIPPPFRKHINFIY